MQVHVGRAQQEQEPGAYCYDGAAGHHCYRSLFSLAAVAVVVARRLGSVYRALRGGACLGAASSRTTSLQVLPCLSFGVGHPVTALRALRTARAPVSPACGPQGRWWRPGRGVSGGFWGRRAGLHSGVRFLKTGFSQTRRLVCADRESLSLETACPHANAPSAQCATVRLTQDSGPCAQLLGDHRSSGTKPR